MSVVTRFAPSPTGRLHAGNLRTALFNWCLARGTGGRFLLRAEDTDAAREGEGDLERQLADLAWLGLDWDAGPDRDGVGGPFRQSERGEIYREYLGRLAETGHAYTCYRTDAELRARRDELRRQGLPPRYDREWAALPQAEILRRREAGQMPAIRFTAPTTGEVAWHDLVRGPRALPASEISDFVLARSGGMPGFLFANALDDALMGVTHVLRGEDHLVNTARQLAILRALELPAPRYGHMPLLAGPDGVKLSKRSGATSAGEFRAAGVLPLALANTLARLGHPWEAHGLMSMHELAQGFDPAQLTTSGQRFDPAHVGHWQRLALDALDDAALASWAGPEAMAAVPPEQREAFLAAVCHNVESPAEVAAWAQLLFGATEVEPWPDTGAPPAVFAAALAAFDAGATDHKALAGPVREATGASGKHFFKPLRMALTGRAEGPELGTLFAVMPREVIRARLARHAQS
ncbi:glutamate--tRNA ligase [Thioalkalivibrio sp. XN279]|uniref:glutamate--tRNA ligase n=1 Tax=Thioalkalivibrio sp. XN279 TaxID=2714953 RepID=UPI00140A8A1D|nr:glutamate--tRNA ligase [Thioalkalivibrio sp. XN279]NHA15513.1 glutamate--tRNA ligase [Thioalkalivibrio sp. XN279]